MVFYIECHYSLTEDFEKMLLENSSIEIISILFGFGNFTDLITYKIR